MGERLLLKKFKSQLTWNLKLALALNIEVERPVESQQRVIEESNIHSSPPRRYGRERHAPKFYGLHIIEGDESMVGKDELTSY